MTYRHSTCERGLVSAMSLSPPAIVLFHLLPQAERPHIRPDLLDIRQALRLGPGLSDIVPTERVLAVGRPDRILLLVVDHDLVDRGVFLIIPVHGSLLSQS